MPAPQPTSIENFLTAALISQGFVKRIPNPATNQFVTIPGVLPDAMASMVKAQALGLSQQWTAWQTVQVVTIPVTSTPGSPSIGSLTP